MSASSFEYEERHKVIDPDVTRRLLEAASFIQVSVETQTDHWFIPQGITSPEEQAHWFDYEHGYALRIREEDTSAGSTTIITSKQLLKDGDHSGMTNNEKPLSVSGMSQVLSMMGVEFTDVVATLARHDATGPLEFSEAKKLIESAGRKEYLVLSKQRSSFQNPVITDVVIDMDSIPALQETSLGFWSSIEFEYTGNGSPDEARQTIRNICQELGFDERDILAKALPGLAIPYLATF